jgi:hypothetical protein
MVDYKLFDDVVNLRQMEKVSELKHKWAPGGAIIISPAQGSGNALQLFAAPNDSAMPSAIAAAYRLC